MNKKKSYRRYSPEFKREAIKRACEEGWIAGSEGPLSRQLLSDGLHCGVRQKVTHSGHSLPDKKWAHRLLR